MSVILIITHFLVEVMELYSQYGNFLENLMPTLNKETKVKD